MASCFKYANVMIQHSQRFTANYQLCLLLKAKKQYSLNFESGLFCAFSDATANEL